VADPKLRWNLATSIDARPTEIWPWLVQMGCRRAGWYSYDGLDNGGIPSENRIVPELQQVQVGDIFPMRPRDNDTFVVRMVEPERTLVIGDAAGGMSWAFVLKPVDEHTTRLITRNRATYDSLALGLFLKVFWHPAHFAMERRQLLNLKRLVETVPPEGIWPWLVQMGEGRGGLYSYDWLDRMFGFLDRPSATRILPEFQELAVGDRICWGREELTVEVLEPFRALVLRDQGHGMDWVWQFGLYPIDDQRTRFVSRGTEFVPNNLLWWLFMRISEPAAFIMTRRFMLGVKQRAEALRASAPSGLSLREPLQRQPSALPAYRPAAAPTRR
jgi:hypothetical protein